MLDPDFFEFRVAKDMMLDHVPHMHQMSVERDGQTVWVDGVRFALGKAIDTDNNCLIDTLRQKLNIVCSTDYVRQELQKLFARPAQSRHSREFFGSPAALGRCDSAAG